MKLSEAMMLGSTTCKMKPGDWNSCGLGCAGNALGMVESNKNGKFTDPRVQAIFDYWPWLTPTHQVGDSLIVAGTPYPAGDIAVLFDKEVCVGTMTFEQLVDHVRSIEPECGECNRFECNCVKAEQPQTSTVEVLA